VQVQHQYDIPDAGGQAINRPAGTEPVWRLDKHWRRGIQGVGTPTWILSHGDASITLTTSNLFNEGLLWLKVFTLSGQCPPWRLGDRQGARRWLAPLLAQCPL
jgi:hypothetical protein